MMNNEEYDGLAERMKRGDGDAFAEFMRLFGVRLYRMFLLMGSSEAEAEELSVSSLSRAAMKIHLYSAGKENGLARWVHAVARNTFIDSKRARTREMAHALSMDPEVQASLLAFPEESLSEPESRFKRVIERALEQLSEIDREIVWARIGEPKVPFLDLATRLGMSEPNLRKRHQRALERLKRVLGADPAVREWSEGFARRSLGCADGPAVPYE
ncbi:RNA polymerase sigma factor [Singulisphaera acidiphila]|uniref:RNA polymerase sigma factor, sigma-70 family n=1 Tax=Singulisphaera acidiphila (strain ATCC BAA-1392 / DSM 18658 / VKM B-2454 / MOB10) TaxID=886293 RepID=L0DPW0_SINAD|nr:RNA polymerase sigma factor [Singulisphaera acidiphila]AGA31399.1 RNA polymerase sigma factor, sigma-70 family [Singulisphaera acidiphila DSM 18658]